MKLQCTFETPLSDFLNAFVFFSSSGKRIWVEFLEMYMSSRSCQKGKRKKKHNTTRHSNMQLCVPIWVYKKHDLSSWRLQQERNLWWIPFFPFKGDSRLGISFPSNSTQRFCVGWRKRRNVLKEEETTTKRRITGIDIRCWYAINIYHHHIIEWSTSASARHTVGFPGWWRRYVLQVSFVNCSRWTVMNSKETVHHQFRRHVQSCGSLDGMGKNIFKRITQLTGYIRLAMSR